MVIVVVLAGYLTASCYILLNSAAKTLSYANELTNHVVAASDFVLISNGLT